jgi:hypothetical protein
VPEDSHNPGNSRNSHAHQGEVPEDSATSNSEPETLPQLAPNQGVRTRLQNNIRKTKQRAYGIVAYLANTEVSEPTDYTLSMHDK